MTKWLRRHDLIATLFGSGLYIVAPELNCQLPFTFLSLEVDSGAFLVTNIGHVHLSVRS